MKGTGDVVTGWQNKLRSAIATVLPAGMAAEQHRRTAAPGSAGRQACPAPQDCPPPDYLRDAWDRGPIGVHREIGWSRTLPFLEAAGRRLEYRVIDGLREAAPPIILLHEGLGSAALWRDFPDQLAAATGSAVLAYSRYGYGQSEPLAELRRPDYMHHEAGASLPDICAQLQLCQPVLVGHSDGASIALLHAASSPDAVRGLVLLAPHVFVEEQTLVAATAAREDYETGGLRTRLARWHADVEATFRGWNDIWLAPEFRAWNIEGCLAAVACPILLIQGMADPYGSAAQLAAISRAVASPDVEELLLPDCGHAPHREHPDTVLAAIAGFLATL